MLGDMSTLMNNSDDKEQLGPTSERGIPRTSDYPSIEGFSPKSCGHEFYDL